MCNYKIYLYLIIAFAATVAPLSAMDPDRIEEVESTGPRVRTSHEPAIIAETTSTRVGPTKESYDSTLREELQAYPKCVAAIHPILVAETIEEIVVAQLTIDWRQFNYFNVEENDQACDLLHALDRYLAKYIRYYSEVQSALREAGKTETPEYRQAQDIGILLLKTSQKRDDSYMVSLSEHVSERLSSRARERALE